MIQQKSFANSSRLSAPQETNDLFAVFYFGYIGGLTAISWAAVLNSLDYFKLMFPSYDVEFVFPNGPNTATLLLSFVITHLSNYISYSTRIITSICGLILMLAIIPFEASLLRETEFGMLVIMGLLFGVGLFANMIYTSIGGYVSQIDGKFTAAFLIGIAISNIIMNILRELTLIIFNPISDAELPPIVAYFILTIGLMLLGLVIHNQFIHSSFHASVEQRKGGYTNSVEDGLEGALIQRPKPKKDIKTLVEVFSRIWFCWGILFIACIQLNTVYPGVMLKKPVDGILPHTKTVSMIATYSCFAIIGKKLGQYRHMYNKSDGHGYPNAEVHNVWTVYSTGNYGEYPYSKHRLVWVSQYCIVCTDLWVRIGCWVHFGA